MSLLACGFNMRFFVTLGTQFLPGSGFWPRPIWICDASSSCPDPGTGVEGAARVVFLRLHRCCHQDPWGTRSPAGLPCSAASKKDRPRTLPSGLAPTLHGLLSLKPARASRARECHWFTNRLCSCHQVLMRPHCTGAGPSPLSAFPPVLTTLLSPHPPETSAE